MPRSKESEAMIPKNLRDRESELEVRLIEMADHDEDYADGKMMMGNISYPQSPRCWI